MTPHIPEELSTWIDGSPIENMAQLPSFSRTKPCEQCHVVAAAVGCHVP
jgi:hypothetical protein